MINKNIFLLIYCLCAVVCSSNRSNAQTISKYIVVDQFGYRPTAQKVAVLRDPVMGIDAAESYTPGSSYALVNTATNAQVLTGSPTIWQNGKIDSSAGDKVWWFDFSSYTTSGSYYVLDIEKNVRSYAFDIKEDVYNGVIKHAFRFFFYQRSGFAKNLPYADAGWVDGASHLKPLQDKNCRYYLTPNDASSEKDLHGGWYDAGDFNKYTSWTGGYIIELLKAYEDSPATWTDDFNIPESNNKIPDILDEVKWGMDYLLRLQNTNGSVISLVGVESASPPSSATQPSKYANPTTAATLKAAAAYAFGARIFRKIGMSCYADSLQNAAIKAWNWADANPSVTWDNSGTGVGAGNPEVDDYGRLMFKLEVAEHLYALTSDSKYLTFFDNNYTQGHLIQWYYANPYEHFAQEVLLYYTTLPNVTPAVVNTIKDRYLTSINRDNNLGAFDSKKASYLSYLDSYVWGSNNIASMQGLMFFESVKYNINPSRDTDAMKAAENYIHYIHGLNPLSQCYLTNMNSYGADKSATQLFHSWFMDGSAKWDQVGVSTYGPAPGFLVGGANASYNLDGCCANNSCGSSGNNALCNNASAKAAIGQPPMKSFADINNSWPLNSWAITEPSCGYQVSYIRLLSKFIKANGTSIVVNVNAMPTVTSPVSYCQNATATALTATGTSLKWYTIATGGTGSTTAPTPSTTATGTTNYYVSQTTNGCESPRATIVVTVNTLPTTPTITSPVTYCQGVTATALTATGTSLKWYTIATGGTGSTTAPMPSTTVTGTTNYYVSQTTNGCESPRATIAVIVNALPTTPTVTSPVTYCQNTTATALAATGTSLKWYTLATGGTASTTAPTPSTAIAGTTNYYVSQTTNTCESPRATIGVTVNALPIAPIVASPVTYCQGATATALTSTGTSLKWYIVATGGTASTTAPTPVTTTAGTTNYYVSQTTNTCEGSRATIAVTVNALPTAPTVTSPVTYCQNATATALTAIGTGLKWYTLATGGTASTTAPTPSTAATGTTNYFVSQTTNTCEGSRALISVQVNEFPLATITPNGPTTFYEGSSVILSANTGVGLTYEWFNGSTPLGTDAAYTATASGNYSVEVTDEFVCKSTSSTTIVIVNSNQPSEILILSPTVNSTIAGSVTISVSATDPDGDIVLIEYLDGTTVIGTSTTSPYSFIWENPPMDTHVLKVRVTDSNGGITTSSPINITTGVSTGLSSLGIKEVNGIVYPVPAREEIMIDAELDLTKASFTAVDVLGEEMILSYSINGTGAKVDISNLTEGVYILIIRQDNALLRKKITVIK